ncbi:MAG TPA: hypothetical protein VD768_02525 [Sphingomicrobium sp.]|nr:hypothetical protein [Sphingomicrobium sp.]
MDHPVVQWTIFAIGAVLLLLSPLVGAVPGPGGVIVAGVGLALMLKTSMWARRHYVRFKRWQPKAGRWTDWALRRRSARRREAMRKQREAAGAGLPLVDEARESAVGGLIPSAPLTPEEASASAQSPRRGAAAAD